MHQVKDTQKYSFPACTLCDCLWHHFTNTFPLSIIVLEMTRSFPEGKATLGSLIKTLMSKAHVN